MTDTNTVPAAATPAEKKTKPEKKTTPAKPAKATQALVTVNAQALSVEVGPAVVAGLAKADQQEDKLTQELQGVATKRYDLLAQTTEAIVKAAKADKSVDLSASFSENKAENNKLMAQIGLALGLREVITIGKGDKAKDKIAIARSVAKFFPGKGDDANDPATKRKQTFRTNFAHLLKKCVQAAHTIVELNITHTVDKNTGTLMLSGPAISKGFGAPSILLNEKQVVVDPGNLKSAIKLEQKPSFTAVAAMSGDAHASAKVGRRGVGGAVSTSTDPQVAVQSICSTLVKALERLGNVAPTPATAEALRSAASAIDNVI